MPVSGGINGPKCSWSGGCLFAYHKLRYGHVMTTKDHSDLAKLQYRIATQRRRVELLLTSSASDPEDAAEASQKLRDLEAMAAKLSAQISGKPAPRRRD